jgi:hypothetical protein
MYCEGLSEPISESKVNEIQEIEENPNQNASIRRG